MDDLKFELLLIPTEVDCGNTTFNSPVNESDSNVEALACYIAGLEAAKCADEQERIVDTIKALKDGSNDRDPSGCNLQTTTSTFEPFVKNIESFVQRINTETMLKRN
ncbi:hypothetical protein PBY51_015667 [Eleginops maclovinus]|uniref:Uncharacterized protein n=1 Tax=Eleginops maclovinus TaxID=56733 RepID=A0AAN7XPX5_ELEMC|nr:hypothetical protein PBY51_015667 [Eleginops maclovinus]